MEASKRNGISKEVRIQPLPEVRVFKIAPQPGDASHLNNEDNIFPINPSPTVTENLSSSSKSFQIFFANITSRQAQDYLFTLSTKVQVIMLAEVHKEERSVIARLKQKKNPTIL